MKKFFAILLAAIMMLSMAAMAEESYSITINDAPDAENVGEDTKETYNAYLIFKATYTDLNDYYTGENGEKIDNENTKVDEVNPISYTISESDPFYEVIDAFEAFELEEINESGVYNVKKDKDYKAEDLAKALNDFLVEKNGDKDPENDIAPTAFANTASAAGEYVIEVTQKGYYFVTSTLGSKIIVDTLGNVEVDSKNTYPTITKSILDGTDKVETITAQRGKNEDNYVTFQIDVEIPATANEHVITVHDVLDDDMTYVEDSIKVVSTKEITENDVTTKVPTAAVTYQDSACKTKSKAGVDCNLEFVISAAEVKANAGKTVSFTYDVYVNADAEHATSHPNTAWLTYSTFKSIEDKVEVFTYQVSVFKYKNVKGEDGVVTETPLPDAGFVVKKVVNEEVTEEVDGETTTTTKAVDYYYKNTDGVVTWVKNIEDATVETSSKADGTLTFTGLKNGNYVLVEKVVPDGYNRADDQPFTISNANVEAANLKVLNSTGTELPSTGGIGTTIFYVVGGLMMAAALVLLVSKRKVSASK